MYQQLNLVWIVVVLSLGAFGGLANAYPFMRSPSDERFRDAEYTAELYELLSEFDDESSMQDAADNRAWTSIDERIPIKPRPDIMASPNVPLESKSKLLHESAPIEGIDYHAHIKQFYPQNEHEGDSDSHKGLPSPRMGNCIQSIDNEEAEEMSAYIWNAWDTTTIPYAFDNTQFRSTDTESELVKDTIMGELNMISSQTCLRFVARTTQTEYLYFRYVFGRDEDRCLVVGHLGREPNQRTTVQMYNWCGKIRGYVQHELLHALGMIHEFRRPDRDNYMRNQREDSYAQYQVDTIGTVYDYSSVMNYWNEDGPQNNQNNNTEYNHQGRPKLLHDWGNPQFEMYYWSRVDIYKLKRLFNCANSGKHGTLKVKINARATLNTEYYSDIAAARATVKVTAKKDDNREVTLSTASKETSNPVWNNEELNFGSARWQSISIRIRVEPNTPGRDNKETPRQQFYVTHGKYDLDHCDKADCGGIKLDFEYELKHSRDPCNPNPCRNGGTCHFGDYTDYTCYCPNNRYGMNCDMLRGRLSVCVLNGDSLSTSFVNLRVNITAYNDATTSFMRQYTSKMSSKKSNEKNPEWFEQHDFDEWVWSKFVIRVIDGPDDSPNILATYSKTLSSFANDATFSVRVNSGYVYIGYDFTAV